MACAVTLDEFYSGETADGAALWSKEYADAKPLFRWWNRTGITACTWYPNLKKMICVIETTCLECGVSTQFDFDTYLLEADSPDGQFPGGSKVGLPSLFTPLFRSSLLALWLFLTRSRSFWLTVSLTFALLCGPQFRMITYMQSFGPEAYFVHIPSRFSPGKPTHAICSGFVIDRSVLT
jgi:hypothetical protein